MEEQEIYLLITRYLQKETTTEENEILADWITDSVDNEQTFEEIKLTWQHTEQIKLEESTIALARLKNRINHQQDNKAKTKKLVPFKWNAVAASVAIIGLFLVGLFYLLKPNDSVPTTYSVLKTRAGEIKTITLIDGTKVSVGPKSVLRYPSVFNNSERNVSLDGEAYFEVSKNPHKPFKVNTGDLTVNVLGTHFNVNASRNQILTTVSLLEGKVEVNLNSDKDDAYVLKPGQELTF